MLVIRFSSIGDIVLTTPVLRCLHQQKGAEVHFLTKPTFTTILQNNPHVTHVISLHNDIKDTIALLTKEHYDFVVDLQRNLRSRRITLALRTRHKAFPKEDLRRILSVVLKKDCCTGRSVVERFFEAVKPLGIEDDKKGLECFFPDEKPQFENYVALVCGAQHATKQIPVEKLKLICQRSPRTIVLLGGKAEAEQLKDVSFSENAVNLCGKTTLAQSANLIRHAANVVTPDTGMMHIAAAYQKDIIAIWGCTTPQMGFFPFRTPHHNMECTLRCRPCSRFGFKQCPKKHYKCMMQQDWEHIISIINHEY